MAVAKKEKKEKKEAKIEDSLGTGRRKSSVARVRIRPGKGKITINKRTLEEYFSIEQNRKLVLAPLIKTEKQGEVDVVIRVNGGGNSGQAGACVLGICRALMRFEDVLEEALREGNFLTRDSRMKERKKYGLHGARKATQFSKR